MTSKFLNISTDNTLGGASPSDETVVSQKAIKDYVDNHGGTTYTAGTGIDITSDVISVDSTVVTTNTNQDITGVKTFIGDKRIKFKQSLVGNKLGFTLYDNNNKEAAAFEYRPNTINRCPLLYLGQYKGSDTSYTNTEVYVGFRNYDVVPIFGAAYNLVAPLAKDAKTPFNLTATYQTFYLPLGVSDGNTTVRTGSDGVLNISTLLPTVDQTYSSSSANAQSGVAVASAIDTMLSSLYPVGSIYIGTQATCPLATLISGSTWTLVSKGRVLQGADTGQTAGSTLAAGLPNIKGSATSTNAGGATCYNNTMTGAIVLSDITGSRYFTSNTTSSTDIHMGIGFDASQSNSIYGNSTTVQPPAYLVNIWERTV